MFILPGVNVLVRSRLSLTESVKVAKVMTKFVKNAYEKDYCQSVIAEDTKELTNISPLLPLCLLDDGK